MICGANVLLSVLFYRRIPFCIIPATASAIVDVILATSVAGYSFQKLIELRAPPLIICFCTIFIISYQLEVYARTIFLNERETESWRLNADDIEIKKSIGKGSFGEVFEGKWKNYQIAVKKILVSDQEELLQAYRAYMSSKNPELNTIERSQKVDVEKPVSMFSKAVGAWKKYQRDLRVKVCIITEECKQVTYVLF